MLDTYQPLARRLLEESELTRQIASTTRDALLTASRIERHPSGHCLFQRGDLIGDLQFVLEGSLEVSMQGHDGRRSICWHIASGQWVGLIPLLDGKGAIHNLRAHTDTVILHVPREAFLAALHNDHILAMQCIDILCERSRATYENMAAQSLLPLRARVARLLLMLMMEHGYSDQRDMEIALKLSQDDFADMLGVTRQSLNRELKALERQGIITIAYSRITLRDKSELQSEAMTES